MAADVKVPLHVMPMAYRLDIDGLPAILALAVLAFHLEPQGFLGGVGIFLVISGYLIGTHLLIGRGSHYAVSRAIEIESQNLIELQGDLRHALDDAAAVTRKLGWLRADGKQIYVLRQAPEIEQYLFVSVALRLLPDSQEEPQVTVMPQAVVFGNNHLINHGAMLLWDPFKEKISTGIVS